MNLLRALVLVAYLAALRLNVALAPTPEVRRLRQAYRQQALLDLDAAIRSQRSDG